MSLIRSAVVSLIRSRGAALALAAACGGSEPATTFTDSGGPGAAGTMPVGAASLLGRWEKPDGGLPPIALELRADAADRVTGRVFLSGVTYDAPATLDETGFVLGAERPRMRGALTADGRLRVRLLDAEGGTQHEALLVKTR